MIDKINGKTKITGLIGNPVEHSISPQLHNTLCEKIKVDSIYLPFKVPKGELERVVLAFKALDFKGFNVTIPYKRDIMEFLDEVSEEARLIGAVNTVKVTENRLIGYNTDGRGFIKLLEKNNISLKDKKILIIGAGGASRAVAIKLAQAECYGITILNRSKDKAEELADFINKNIVNTVKADTLNMEAVSRVSKEADIIINTTPVGMWPNTDKSPIESEIIFKNKPVVIDLIYNPLKTRFLSEAEKNSCKIINGLGMLIYQGIFASEIWNDTIISEEISDELLKNFEDYFGQLKDFM